jgi:hypothetical protein
VQDNIVLAPCAGSACSLLTRIREVLAQHDLSLKKNFPVLVPCFLPRCTCFPMEGVSQRLSLSLSLTHDAGEPTMRCHRSNARRSNQRRDCRTRWPGNPAKLGQITETLTDAFDLLFVTSRKRFFIFSESDLSPPAPAGAARRQPTIGATSSYARKLHRCKPPSVHGRGKRFPKRTNAI